MKQKTCVVITTINPPTVAIRKFIDMDGLDVVIVADKKTPVDAYAGLDCVLLTIEEQHRMFPAFDALLPFNHYARKNMGYLYAIRQGYQTILETDDDNMAPRRFVWKPTVTIAGGRSAVWACGQVALAACPHAHAALYCMNWRLSRERGS